MAELPDDARRRIRAEEAGRMRALLEEQYRQEVRDELEQAAGLDAPPDTQVDQVAPAPVLDAARARAQTLPSARQLRVDGVRVMRAVRVPGVGVAAGRGRGREQELGQEQELELGQEQELEEEQELELERREAALARRRTWLWVAVGVVVIAGACVVAGICAS